MMAKVKLVAQVKLLPSPEQAAGMKATLHACNDAANWVSAVAFGMTSRRNYDVAWGVDTRGVRMSTAFSSSAVRRFSCPVRIVPRAEET